MRRIKASTSANLRSIITSTCAFLLVFLSGCASKPPVVVERDYREIPAGYLQPCELPAKPTDTGDLSEGFVVAYKCAEQGNRDKERIRDLIE